MKNVACSRLGTMKTSHKGFCLATLEKLMKYCPGGSYLVLKSNPRFPGESPVLAIGYKYNSRKVLGFIATEGARSTEPSYNFTCNRWPGMDFHQEILEYSSNKI